MAEPTSGRFGVTLLAGKRVRYHHFSGAVLAGTYVLAVLGAYTSAIGAGLACPDWPTCYGTLVPFLHPDVVDNAPYTALQIFAEWAHRGVAAIVGIGIIATAGAAFQFRKPPLVRWTAAAALVLLPVQVLLGRLTVTANLQPLIVTSHLGTAIVILLLLCTTTVTDYLVDDSSTEQSSTRGSIIESE